ncbi:hypothetical protein Mgra_00006769 [Meloidogyne graminicola]|uniref:Uncharacterized protein n=1 Tax=Meloidogyne graminicola TaxID=189291 RepID=A0A8S9ZKG8_9BILA|nr:hypothetical protein Mgra_00006769 [Meloidogyne graminicola]
MDFYLMVATNSLNNQQQQQISSASCSLFEGLESALNEFKKLKIEANCKIQTTCKTMRRTGMHYYDYNKLRFSPYKIPKSNIDALRNYLCSLVTKTPKQGDYNQELLVNIQLKGCNFYGKSLQKNVFIKTKAMPCWLQHNKKSLIWRNPTKENQELTTTSSIDNIQIDEENNEEKTDLGLNELSDYFQHFVCLCSPKMSDLAQKYFLNKKKKGEFMDRQNNVLIHTKQSLCQCLSSKEINLAPPIPK